MDMQRLLLGLGLLTLIVGISWPMLSRYLSRQTPG